MPKEKGVDVLMLPEFVEQVIGGKKKSGLEKRVPQTEPN